MDEAKKRSARIQEFLILYNGIYSIQTFDNKLFNIYLYPADLLKLIQKEGFSNQDIIAIANKEFSIPFNKIIIKVIAYCENG
jgi:cupin superfamily acireductone dioxygenase involved in methionine salvage